MHPCNVAALQPGMTVARTVLSDRGMVLLRLGATLTQVPIERLRQQGILSIYVQDEGADEETIPQETLDDETRAHALGCLSALYDFAANREERRAVSRDSARRVLGRAAPPDRLLEDVLSTVERVMAEVFNGDLLVGVAALKSADGYAFQHGIDTAVLGALLSRKLWLPQKEVRDLVAGLLVIDIGNLAVPRAIREKTGELTQEEFEQVQRHTSEGYEMLKRMGWDEALPRHVVYQHHERQDGKGYPRGLRGTNRAVRTGAQQRDGRLILQIAEIAAIADAFDALCSDRPDRKALPIEAAVATLSRQARGALNEEMVKAFLALVPTYLLGMRVVLDGAGFHGERGVVTGQNGHEPDRPTVRLYQDASGEPMRKIVRTEEHGDIEVLPLAAEAAADPTAA